MLLNRVTPLVYMQARPVLAQISSEEALREVADPSLNGAYDVQEMMRMMEAAAACVRHSANKRPRMGQVHCYFLERDSFSYFPFNHSGCKLRAVLHTNMH